MEQKKRGRPSKGDSTRLTFRLPTELVAAIRERAAESGMTATDVATEILGAEFGIYPHQEGLPLSKAS